MTTITRRETVEAIVETQADELCCYSAEDLKSMKKLTLLQVRGQFTSSEPIFLPEQLKWIWWFCYPFRSLRIIGDMSKLVGLEMTYNYIEQLQIKVDLKNLTFINLQHSAYIESFPDVSMVPNLEFLNLSHCRKLKSIHNSVFCHEKIIHLDLSYSEELKKPAYIKMKSLQSLHLPSCTWVWGYNFPEFMGEMGKLLVLNINCWIYTLPLSFKLLTGLSVFSMKRSVKGSRPYDKFKGPSIGVSSLPSFLRTLNLRNHSLYEHEFPTNLHEVWPHLEELDLSGNNFTYLPESISLLSRLKYLNLSDCAHLKELPKLPSLIQVLKADHCLSLQKIEDRFSQ
ncbi:hypothetical protein QVD17_36108 [Tagetes erecta]|uniref:Disease resistance protein RPS4B/Roq1-like leucine-rich repeats domain-containing protein n=1 Tax=Tagetes erecta TaxID=13708 RepID=A0AAD8JTY0_TARER|nr:hypothetical protein QVD17_36108 [Tagetes erecta]